MSMPISTSYSFVNRMVWRLNTKLLARKLVLTTFKTKQAMTTHQPAISLWHKQLPHFLGLAILLSLCFCGWRYLGSPHATAFWLAVIAPVVHQIFVWLCWRLELTSKLITRTIGFTAYVVLFFILFGSRFVSLIWLGYIDNGTFAMPMAVQIVVCLITIALGGYAMYSVKRYFGMARATGADHFDEKYRTMPLVKQGIFRFTNNGMYIYAFLLFWFIAFAFSSASATLVAAFSHAYIWLHFYCTEKPDMEYIYHS